MSSDEILNVFKIVAITLKLSNLIFTPTTNIDGTAGCEIRNDYGKLFLSKLRIHCIVDAKAILIHEQ